METSTSASGGTISDRDLAPAEKDELVGVDVRVLPLRPRFLVTEASELIREVISDYLAGRHLEFEIADTPSGALELIEKRRYDILILDSDLSGGDAFALLERFPRITEDAAVIVTSWSNDADAPLKALRAGAQDFIVKPFEPGELDERLNAVIERWRSRSRANSYQAQLEELVGAMTDKVLSSDQLVESSYDAAVRALGAALNLRDAETEEHCRRVAENTVVLAARLGYPASGLKQLKWGAYLHDIGKIGLSEEILNKRSELDTNERALMQLHPFFGFRIVSRVTFLKESTDIILYHHERYDGEGYMLGLVGRQIPLAARIFAIIDAMDAMLCDRSYRAATGFSHMVRELKRQSGKQFDPEVVAAFLEVPEAAWWKARG